MGNTLVYHEYLPENARILVDYKKPPKERVKFDYPQGNYTFEKSLWKRVFPTMWAFYYRYILIPILGGIASFMLTTTYLIPLLHGVWLWPRSFAPAILPSIPQIIMDISVALLIIGAFAIPPILLTLYFKKHPDKLAYIFPKINYHSYKGFEKYLEILPEDIKADKVFAIPKFKNIYLDYKAEGDFNKALDGVEIIEYPYNFRRKFRGKIGSKVINEYVWRGMFKFNKVPTSGRLIVNYV